MCGLIGYCGSKPANPLLIKLLMMYNEDRGSDAAGWAVNNKVTKDSVKVSKFLSQNELEISETDDNYTVIAHARKASSGSHFSKELAHPFGMYSTATEKNKYDLILAMNGTLWNHKEMADKWGVEFKERDNSDTQILAKIMALLGPKEFKLALESYGGTATLLFFSPRHSNTLMVFRDFGRELFYWQKESDEIYISSIEESLHSMGASKTDTKSFTSSHLYKIVKGKIVSDELIENKPIPVKLKKSSTYYDNSMGYRKDYYEGVADSMNQWSKNMGAMRSRNVANYGPKVSRNDACSSTVHADKKGVYHQGDKYFRTGHPAQGMFRLTDKGDIVDSTDIITKCKNYYFINGYMCKDEKSYSTLLSKVSDSNGYQLNKFKVMLTSEMVEYFMYPAIVIAQGRECWVLNDAYADKNKLKRGDKIEIDMFLSEGIVTVKYEGDLTNKTEKVVADEFMYAIKPKPVTETNDIDIIESTHPREHSINYLKNQLSYAGGLDTADYLFNKITTDYWRCNSRPRIKEYFYTMLLEMMLTDDVILKEKFDDLTNQGTKQLWAGSDFIDSIDEAVVLYKAKVRDERNNTLKVVDKKATHTDIELSEDDIIKSIQERNPIYKLKTFADDVCDIKYQDLDQLGLTLVAEADENHANWRYFYEAILLVLHNCGKIQDSELLWALEQEIDILKQRAENVYEEWYNIFSKPISNDEDEDEDVNEVVIENWDEGDVEKSFQDRLTELVGHMKDIVQQGEITKDEVKLMSPKTEKLLAIITDTMKFIEKRVKDDKLLEK